jgi:hypothetical protein
MPRLLRRVLLPILLAGCVPAVPAPAPQPSVGVAEAWVADRLFFGRNVPGGGTVSEEEWTAFLAEVVTPRFPDGLTVLRAEGQWRDGQGAVIREHSFVLEIAHPATPAADAALEEIAAEYKRRFRQESVMRLRTAAEVRFHE